MNVELSFRKNAVVRKSFNGQRTVGLYSETVVGFTDNGNRFAKPYRHAHPKGFASPSWPCRRRVHWAGAFPSDYKRVRRQQRTEKRINNLRAISAGNNDENRSVLVIIYFFSALINRKLVQLVHRSKNTM